MEKKVEGIVVGFSNRTNDPEKRLYIEIIADEDVEDDLPIGAECTLVWSTRHQCAKLKQLNEAIDVAGDGELRIYDATDDSVKYWKAVTWCPHCGMKLQVE